MANSLAPLWRRLSRTVRLSPSAYIRWASSTSDAHEEVLQDRGGRNKACEQEQWLAEPVVAIVGQPNVGKSALFNALVGGRRALVYNTPKHGDHVTRDIRSETTTLRGGYQGDFKATVCDTPGLEILAVRRILSTFSESESLLNNGLANLQQRAAWKVIDLLRKCHLVVMVVDARKGIGPGDEDVARLIGEFKRQDAPVILVSNKSEREVDRLAAESDAHALTGIDVMHSLSAETKIGVLDLQLLLSQHLPEDSSRFAEPSSDSNNLKEIESTGEEAPSRQVQPMKLAFIGLPNVGKSSLVNAIAGEERVLTGPERGLTRDAIAVQWNFKGEKIELIDTAGWKQPQKISDRVEQLTHANTQRVLKSSANVFGLVLDPVTSTNMGEFFRLRFGNLLNKGDIKLLSWLVSHQKAVMVVVNKMDLVPKEIQESIAKRLEEQISYTIPEIAGLPIIPVSAKSKKGVFNIIDEASKLYYDRWSIHINTSRLNQWLAKTNARVSHGPSSAIDRIRFICQTGTSPPVFSIDVRGKTMLKRHERRFVENSIRNDFRLRGVPIKVVMRPRSNPYVSNGA